MSDESVGQANVERALFLRSMAVARPPPGQADRLAALMRDVFYPAGSTVYRQGESASRIFFVVAGEIELTTEGQPSWILGPRSILGSLDVIRDVPYGRTATAVTDLHLLALPAEDWMEVLEDDFEFARMAIAGIARGLVELAKELDGAGLEAPVVRDEQDDAPPSSVLADVEAHGLDLVGRLLVLRSVRAFGGAGIQGLTSLAEAGREVTLAADERLFAAGEVRRGIWIVARGLVDVRTGGPDGRVVASFGPGALVCGAAAFAPSHGFEARAAAPSVVLHIGEEDLLDRMEVHFEVTRSVLAFLASERVRMNDVKAALQRARASVPAPDAATVPMPVGA